MTRTTVYLVFSFLCFVSSCTRKEIDFGTIPENSYTRLVYIDTVGISMSTVIVDSFSTGNAQSFLIGKFKDPYLGLVSTQPFFQLSKPADIPDIPDNAVFDSLSCIIRPNKYYYGDTTKAETINVYELAQPISLSYNNQLYNTSKFEVNTLPLGSQSLIIRPGTDDSVFIRLDAAKGQELFAKLRSKEDIVSNQESFLNYFKGLSLTTGANDTSVVYGIKDTVIMRVSYHINDPFPTSKAIDFVSIVNTEAFNQILADRNATGLVASGKGYTEIPISQTNHFAFSQAGTGLYLKMTFPGLKGVIQSENIVRLLKAELIVRPVPQSFDMTKFRLPSQMYLIQTNASNIPGYSVTDPTSGDVLYVDPVIDNLYWQNNYYSFDITSAIGTMLNTAGSENDGFYMVQGQAGSSLTMERLIAGDATTATPGFTTQLRLSVLVINK